MIWGGCILPTKKSNAWAELVVVPAVLVIVGFVILRWLDGQWWGVVLWVLVSPLVYLGLDFLFFGRSRIGDGDGDRDRADASRRRHVVAAKADPSAHASGRARPEWKAEQETSTGAEILRRGRRYDRRRA